MLVPECSAKQFDRPYLFIKVWMQGFTSIVLIGMLPGALTLTSPFCFECFVTYVTVLFCLVGFI